MKNKNKTDIKDLLQRGRKGDACVYHIGALASDRLRDPSLSKTADVALEGYQEGKLELFQRKLAKNRYEYIALRVFGVPRRKFEGCYR